MDEQPPGMNNPIVYHQFSVPHVPPYQPQFRGLAVPFVKTSKIITSAKQLEIETQLFSYSCPKQSLTLCHNYRQKYQVMPQKCTALRTGLGLNAWSPP